MLLSVENKFKYNEKISSGCNNEHLPTVLWTTVSHHIFLYHIKYETQHSRYQKLQQMSTFIGVFFFFKRRWRGEESKGGRFKNFISLNSIIMASLLFSLSIFLIFIWALPHQFSCIIQQEVMAGDVVTVVMKRVMKSSGSH